MNCNNPFNKTIYLQMKLIVNTKGRQEHSQSLEYQPPQQQKFQPKPHHPIDYKPETPKPVEKAVEPVDPPSAPFLDLTPPKETDKELNKADLPDGNVTVRQLPPCVGKPIVPQNAIMSLRNLKDVDMGEFIITNNPNGGFVASVAVNGRAYKGHGRSKKAAKNCACEKAMRDYLQEKAGNNGSNKLVNEPNTNFSSSTGVVRMDKNAGAVNIDETMVDLAAFALYKLLTEWRNEGFTIPEKQPPANPDTNVCKGVKPVLCSDLPENWKTMHPAEVLCLMGHSFSYIDKGYTWVPTDINLRRAFGITVGGKDFIAIGSSIKAARRNVAAVACNALYNTDYEMVGPQNP